MRMVPASDDHGAWFVVVDNLPDQALSSRLELNVKRIGILCGRCTNDSNPGCLDPIPDQPTRINRDPSFEWLEGVGHGCERPRGLGMAGRGELVGGWHGPRSTTDVTNDKGRYHW